MSWQRIDLSAEEYLRPPEAPAVCGVIYRRMRHLLSGPPEAAKTLLALIAGLEWIRAGHGGFALVDFEMGPHATRRLLADLGATPAEFAAIGYFSPHGPPDKADIAAIVAAGVTFVAIDAAAGAFDASGLDDNSRRDVERWAATWIDSLQERDITTLTLDHVVKNREARGRYAIGSERKLGHADIAVGVEAVELLTRGGTGRIRVDVHKDRPGYLRLHPVEVHLQSHPDTHALTWQILEPVARPTADAGDKRRPAEAKVLAALEAADDPLTWHEVQEWIARNYSDRPLTRETVSKALNALQRDGLASGSTTTVGKEKRWTLGHVTACDDHTEVTSDHTHVTECDHTPEGGHTVTRTHDPSGGRT